MQEAINKGYINMTRRNFFNYAITGAASLALPLSWLTDQPELTFGLVADTHQDLLHDVENRLEKFMEATEQRPTDFILQLGDFCHPKKENNSFMALWNSYPNSGYHVLGNHDMDLASKQEAMDFWEMPSNYYSFDQKGFHFVVLDANYLNKDGDYEDYNRANFYVDADLRTWINPEQLEWLAADLAETDLPTIVFSHQSLVNDLWGIRNRTKVQQILEKANENNKKGKVLACFNGHNHIDYCRNLNGIYYIDINSMSYQWLGQKYECTTRYPQALYDQYPHLSKMATYQDSLYAFITVKNGILKLEGQLSNWVGPSPASLGLTEEVYGFALSPTISDRKLKMK